MSFLDDLFAKKPGGTLVGNVFRQVSSSVSNGALGQGGNMMSWAEYDLQNMSDTDFVAKYGRRKNGEKIAGVTPNPDIKTQAQFQYELQTGQTDKANAKGFGNLLKKYWWVVAIPFGLIIIVIICGFKIATNKKTKFYVK